MFSHLKRANTEHLFEKVGCSRKCSTINNTVGERLAHFDHRCTAFLNIWFSLHCRFQNTLSWSGPSCFGHILWIFDYLVSLLYQL